MDNRKRVGVRRGDKAGIVCCSNPMGEHAGKTLAALEKALREVGLIPLFSNDICGQQQENGWPAARRAGALMEFYRNEEIRVIFDISGGDLANEVLPYLDYETILQSGKQFWGYSDLTTVLNAVGTKWEAYRRRMSLPDEQQRGWQDTPAVLYQIRNLTGPDAQRQRERFCRSAFDGTEELFAFDYDFVQGESLEGITADGNIRCLLKLAGTPYWPDLNGRILLLEALGGLEPQMRTYLAQLHQLGVFRQVRGILLGTFTKLEEQGQAERMAELVCSYAGGSLPVVKTSQVGHGTDSRAVAVGAYLSLHRNACAAKSGR